MTMLDWVLGGLAVIAGAVAALAGFGEITGFARPLRLSRLAATAAGVLSGVFGGLVGNQGGIRSAALLRFDIPPQALVATATATALLVDIARLSIYIVTSGPELLDEWPTVLVLTAGVLVGTLVGAPVLRRVPEAVFRSVLAILLILLGAWLIIGIP